MKIIFEKAFDKQFSKLPSKIAMRFHDRLKLFLNNKFDQILNNHSVHPTYPNSRSINVTGDYRAIFKEEENIVIFIAIGTHPQLYKQ